MEELFNAISNQTTEEISSFLKDRSQPKDLSEIVNSTGPYGCSPLIWAIMHDKNDVAELLLLQGADLEAKNFFGETAFMWACWQGNLTLARRLHELGAKADTISFKGKTAYSGAKYFNRLKILDFLEFNGHTPIALTSNDLIQAIQRGNLGLFQNCLREGVSVHSPNEEGVFPLGQAVVYGNPAMVIELLERGAPLDQLDRDNKTPLYQLSCIRLWGRNYHEILKLLLEHGADPNADEGNKLSGYTPINRFMISYSGSMMMEDSENPHTASGTPISKEAVQECVRYRRKSLDLLLNYGAIFKGMNYVRILDPRKREDVLKINDILKSDSDDSLLKKQQTFIKFCKNNGIYNESKILQYMEGIDHARVSEPIDLPSGFLLRQFQVPGAPTGLFFTHSNSRDPSSLGISSTGKTQNGCEIPKESQMYQTHQKVRAWLSCAAPITDTWSNSKSIDCEGGSEQILIPETEHLKLRHL